MEVDTFAYYAYNYKLATHKLHNFKWYREKVELDKLFGFQGSLSAEKEQSGEN